METTLRRLLKATSWYLIGIFAVFLVSWIMTASAKIAMTIAFIEIIARFFLYWLHEHVWSRTNWGIYNQRLPRL